MHDSNNERLSVEELVYNYNSKNQCKTTIKIYEGGIAKGKCHIIKSVFGSRQTQKVVFDPAWSLKVGEYVGAYYCNTMSELQEIIQYLFNESLLNDEKESEDILDLKETVRLVIE